MSINRKRHNQIVKTVAAAMLAGVSFVASAGPLGVYYLDNFREGKIYAVQGNTVIDTIPTVYNSVPGNYQEGNLAVTSDGIATTGFGSNYGGPFSAGQYTLSGTPTGPGYLAQATPGFSGEVTQDGTSDGMYNYTVQWDAVDSSQGIRSTNVIRSDLNWQNPSVLFAVDPYFIGITYDPTNQSLWLSHYVSGGIFNYSLTGALLSSFSTPIFSSALALDHQDNTLWASLSQTNTLVQYSKAGALLQKVTIADLPLGKNVAGEFAALAPTTVPEPELLALIGLGVTAMSLRRRQGSKILAL